MKNEEIIKSNKLLAKFMDIEVVEVDFPSKTLMRKNQPGEGIYDEYVPNSDWNDLMEVYLKIRDNQMEDFSDYKRMLLDKILNSLYWGYGIVATYERIVEFVKGWNKCNHN